MQVYEPEEIHIERAALASPISRNVLERSPHTPFRVVESSEELLEQAKRLRPSIARGKRWLVLARHPGRFFKPCPASQTRGEVRNACCNYFVINYASNCHMECSYCYLQSYLNFPYLIVYANVEELLQELHQVISTRPGEYFRVGTGELADSLALDHLTGYSAPLVEFFSRQKNAVLEFKTKSDVVDSLLQLDHRGRTIVSWSLSPPFIQQREEHKTASVAERLQAAQKCVAAGYPVAFHLDPLVHYPAWRKDYQALVEAAFQQIPARSIAWISLGSLRLTAELQRLMRQRFPGSILPLGELVPSGDGKLRYFKPIRVQMYREIRGWIGRRSPRTPVYACMEREDVWRKAFGSPPSPEKELGRTLVQMSG